jgi:Protein of unknown function (DUF1822)
MSDTPNKDPNIKAMNSYQFLNPAEATTLSIPLGFTAHDWAAEQCKAIADRAAHKRKYASSLALYAMHRYFTYLAIDTDLTISSLNRNELAIIGIGRLICAWSTPADITIALPDDSEDRAIGCVVLQMEGDLEAIEDLTELKIVGFTPNLASQIALSRLGSTDDLLELLQMLKAEALASDYSDQAEALLSDYLDGYFGPIAPLSAADTTEIFGILEQLTETNEEFKASGIFELLKQAQEEEDQSAPAPEKESTRSRLTEMLQSTLTQETNTLLESLEPAAPLLLELINLLGEVGEDTSIESIEPALILLLEQIEEVLPQLSVETIMVKFSELLQTTKNPEEAFLNWLQRTQEKRILEPGEDAQSFESSEIEQSLKSTEEPNEEDIKQKLRQLRKLSSELLKAWK